MTEAKKKYKIYTYEQIREDQEKFDEVYEYIRMYGSHTLAYSILQPKMNYFIIEGLGLVAYAKTRPKSKRRFVLGDPLAGDKEGIVTTFLHEFPKSFFVQVSEETAKIIAEKGFYATPMGVETRLNLIDFSWEGKKKKYFRRNIRRCEGTTEIIEENDNLPFIKEQIEKVSASWLNIKKRGRKEMRFLTRPLINPEEISLRKFFALKDKEVVGFSILAPLFEKGIIKGYGLDVTRISKAALNDTGDLLWSNIINLLKKEGICYLQLGLSPFYNLHIDNLDKQDRYTKKLVEVLYHKGNSLFNFKGLAYHKKQLEGCEKSVYFCHDKRFPLVSILSIFKICNII